jgi:hypothetical protein
MSGIKGKSGLKKGQTNNTKGRPPGSKNTLSKDLREAFYDRVKQDKIIEKALDNLRSLEDPQDYLAECRWLFRYMLPAAVSQEELDAIVQSQSTLVNRLFRKDETEE